MAENTGNSEGTGADFLDEVADSVMDDSNFFDNLEESVNGVIADPADTPPVEQVTPASETTPVATAPEVVETPDSPAIDKVDWDSESNPYKKRYADSSRENTKNQDVLRENERYGAIIDVMKKDPGLVDNVRNYLEGNTKSAKEELNLDDDFVFDADDAFGDPNSKSAQVFSNVVNRIVDQKVSQSENKVANVMQQETQKRNQGELAKKWWKDNDMSKEDFSTMMQKANAHTISYDDINLILNKDRYAKNVASNQKKEVEKQVQNVRAAATPSVSASGNVDTSAITEEDQVFSALLGMEKDEGLFDS